MLNFNFLQFIHNLHSLTLYTYVNTFNSKDSYNLGHILFWERDNYLISRNVFVPLHRVKQVMDVLALASIPMGWAINIRLPKGEGFLIVFMYIKSPSLGEGRGGSELCRPYRADKLLLLNMVALPHYPVICRPFRTRTRFWGNFLPERYNVRYRTRLDPRDRLWERIW